MTTTKIKKLKTSIASFATDEQKNKILNQDFVEVKSLDKFHTLFEKEFWKKEFAS